MAVSTEGIAETDAFSSVLSVVSEAFEHFSQRAYAASQPGTAAVVFKADDCALSGVISQLESIIPDHPLFPSDRVEINGSQKFTFFSVSSLIIVSHHLISTADTQKCLPVFQGSPNLRSFP